MWSIRTFTGLRDLPVNRLLHRIRKKECILGILLVVVIVWLSLQLFEYPDDTNVTFDSDEPLFHGRSESDGTWYSQRYPYHFHLYSAFYDNRTTLGSSVSHLRIIVVMETLLAEYRLFCKISFPRAAVLRVSIQEIGAGVKHRSKLFREYILTCDLPRDDPPPRSVTIIDNRRKLNVSRIPVEVPQRAEVQEFLAVCVSVSYYELNPRSLVEWLEMQKILGVSKVFIYNNSITGEAANGVLSAYRDEGFVVLRQSFSFLYGTDERLIHLHASPVINDCMYRHMHGFRYFAVIDLDEVIVPRRFEFLPEFVSGLRNTLKSKRVGSYVFRNAYFFFDLVPKAHTSKSEKSIYLEHRRRLPESPPEDSVKSVVDSQACVAMHNHYCRKYAEEVLSRWDPIVDIPPEFALLHHYKWCHFDAYLGSKGTCAQLMKSAVFDDIMKRYRYRILKSLNMQLEKLGLA